MKTRVFPVARPLIAVAVLICFTGATVEKPKPLPAALNNDVSSVYGLLVKTFYRPLDGRVVLEGAHAALLAYARKHGAGAPLPAPDSADTRHPVDYVARAIAAMDKPGDPSAAASAALHGMAASAHDRWTEYFDASEFKKFIGALDPPGFSGIGVLLGTDAATKCPNIQFTTPQGPADTAGARAGDVITAIDGKSACGMQMADVSKRLRGPDGAVVVVALRRTGEADPVNLQITRRPVQTPTVFEKMLSDDVGYVAVVVFGAPTPEEFTRALTALQSRHPKAIILDLRDDGGGYVNAAVSVASHFLTSGPVVTTVTQGSAITQSSDDEAPMINVPVAVLVNQYTASASEIAASALAENRVATLIGTRTFGKGVEQTVSRFPDGSAIKITTARYLTAQNHDLNGKGLVPEVVVQEPNPTLGDVAHDAQLRAAMTFLSRIGQHAG